MLESYMDTMVWLVAQSHSFEFISHLPCECIHTYIIHKSKKNAWRMVFAITGSYSLYSYTCKWSDVKTIVSMPMNEL